MRLVHASAAVPATNASEAVPLLNRPSDWLEWFKSHRASVSLVLSGARGESVVHDPYRQRVIASLGKLLPLATYAVDVSSGVVDARQPVAVQDWEAYVLPGSDGGAHIRALDSVGIPRRGWRATDGLRTIPLSSLVRAMIAFSDNAAADHLCELLGAARVCAVARSMDWQAPDVRLCLGDVLMLLMDESPQRGERSADVGRRLVERYLGSTAYRARAERAMMATSIDDYERQQRWAGSTPRACAVDVANVLVRIGRSARAASGGLAQRYLESRRTMPVPDAHGVGFKGGALCGVLAAGMYVRWEGGDVSVGVLLIEGLTAQDWLRASSSASHAALLRLALVDKEWRDRVAAALLC